jgi:hypothetical protein
VGGDGILKKGNEMSIQTFDTGGLEGAGMVPHDDGEWVRLDDHRTELATKRLDLKALLKKCKNTLIEADGFDETNMELIREIENELR